MTGVSTRLQLQGSVAALLSAAHSQGAEEGVPAPDGYGLLDAEQAAAEKAVAHFKP